MNKVNIDEKLSIPKYLDTCSCYIYHPNTVTLPNHWYTGHCILCKYLLNTIISCPCITVTPILLHCTLLFHVMYYYATVTLIHLYMYALFLYIRCIDYYTCDIEYYYMNIHVFCYMPVSLLLILIYTIIGHFKL